MNLFTIKITNSVNDNEDIHSYLTENPDEEEQLKQKHNKLVQEWNDLGPSHGHMSWRYMDWSSKNLKDCLLRDLLDLDLETVVRVLQYMRDPE